jgi:hypothetical protein
LEAGQDHMSKTNSQVNYVLTANSAGAESAFGRLSKEIEKTNARAGMLKDAVGFAGKELDKFAKIGGLVLIGRELDRATEKAVELRNAFNAGTISAAEMAQQFVDTIPIVGQFAQAGRNIRELFTGEIAAATEALKEANSEMQNLVKKNSDDIGARKAIRTTAEETRFQVRREAATPDGQARMDADKQRDDAMKALQEQSRKLIATGGMRGEEFAAAKKAIEDLHRQRMDQLDAEHAESLRLAAVAARKKAEVVEEAERKTAERQRRLVDQFATEDRVEGLETQRGEIADSLREMQSRQPRRGAAVSAVTDVGRGAVLAGMERRSADPTLKLQSESKRKLEDIDKTLKAIAEEQKRRNRMNQLGGDPIF